MSGEWLRGVSVLSFLRFIERGGPSLAEVIEDKEDYPISRGYIVCFV